MIKFAEQRARLSASLETNAVARYLAAILLVLGTIAFRASLDHVFSPGVYYHLYYPAVILAVYFFGVGPGTFAAVLSAACAYLIFSPNALQFEDATMQTYVPLVTFGGVSAVAIFVLSHVRSRLRTLSQEFARIDALTASQADLFREHAERVGDHLQHISALLHHHAGRDARAAVARALKNAASRTLLISRMHREFAGTAGGRIDVQAFMLRLADSVLAAHGRPPLTVAVEGDRLDLPLEQASALALILIECMKARLTVADSAAMQIVLTSEGSQATFEVLEKGTEAKRQRNADLLGAIAEHIGASLVLAGGRGERSLRVTFPTDKLPLLESRDHTALNRVMPAAVRGWKLVGAEGTPTRLRYAPKPRRLPYATLMTSGAGRGLPDFALSHRA